MDVERERLAEAVLAAVDRLLAARQSERIVLHVAPAMQVVILVPPDALPERFPLAKAA